MATVKQIIEAKGKRPTLSVDAGANVLEALKVMAEADIGAVMVKEGERIIGIFTERDYARKCELQGLSASETPLREMMTSEMVTVNSGISADDCMGIMDKHRIRHLPVLDDNELVGIVSLRDMVKILLEDRESAIKGLENYILISEFPS